MSPIEAVLFDWDGTLVDSRAALLAAWHVVTRDVLGSPWPVTGEDERVAFGRRGREVFPTLTDDPRTATALAEGFQRAYDPSEISAFPGIPELLDTVRDAGRATAVITSKARLRYDADAARTGLTPRVDLAVCAEDVGRGKPDPEPVHAALRALAVAPSAAVLVGDSVADMAAARAAGVPAVGVAWGITPAADLRTAGATAVAGSPGELRRLLGCPDGA